MKGEGMKELQAYFTSAEGSIKVSVCIYSVFIGYVSCVYVYIVNSLCITQLVCIKHIVEKYFIQ